MEMNMSVLEKVNSSICGGFSISFSIAVRLISRRYIAEWLNDQAQERKSPNKQWPPDGKSEICHAPQSRSPLKGWDAVHRRWHGISGYHWWVSFSISFDPSTKYHRQPVWVLQELGCHLVHALGLFRESAGCYLPPLQRANVLSIIIYHV